MANDFSIFDKLAAESNGAKDRLSIFDRLASEIKPPEVTPAKVEIQPTSAPQTSSIDIPQMKAPSGNSELDKITAMSNRNIPDLNTGSTAPSPLESINKGGLIGTAVQPFLTAYETIGTAGKAIGEVAGMPKVAEAGKALYETASSAKEALRPKDFTPTQEYVDTVVKSVSDFAPAALLGGTPLIAAKLFSDSAASTYNNMRTKYDPATSAAASTAAGLGTMSLGMIPVMKIANEKTAPLWAHIANSAFGVTVGSAAMQLADAVIAKSTYDTDLTWDEIWHGIANSMKTSPAVGAIFGLGHAQAKKAADRAEVTNKINDISEIQNINRALRDTVVSGDIPEGQGMMGVGKYSGLYQHVTTADQNAPPKLYEGAPTEPMMGVNKATGVYENVTPQPNDIPAMARDINAHSMPSPPMLGGPVGAASRVPGSSILGNRGGRVSLDFLYLSKAAESVIDMIKKIRLRKEETKNIPTPHDAEMQKLLIDTLNKSIYEQMENMTTKFPVEEGASNNKPKIVAFEEGIYPAKTVSKTRHVTPDTLAMDIVDNLSNIPITDREAIKNHPHLAADMLGDVVAGIDTVLRSKVYQSDLLGNKLPELYQSFSSRKSIERLFDKYSLDTGMNFSKSGAFKMWRTIWKYQHGNASLANVKKSIFEQIVKEYHRQNNGEPLKGEKIDVYASEDNSELLFGKPAPDYDTSAWGTFKRNAQLELLRFIYNEQGSMRLPGSKDIFDESNRVSGSKFGKKDDNKLSKVDYTKEVPSASEDSSTKNKITPTIPRGRNVNFDLFERAIRNKDYKTALKFLNDNSMIRDILSTVDGQTGESAVELVLTNVDDVSMEMFMLAKMRNSKADFNYRNPLTKEYPLDMAIKKHGKIGHPIPWIMTSGGGGAKTGDQIRAEEETKRYGRPIRPLGNKGRAAIGSILPESTNPDRSIMLKELEDSYPNGIIRGAPGSKQLLNIKMALQKQLKSDLSLSTEEARRDAVSKTFTAVEDFMKDPRHSESPETAYAFIYHAWKEVQDFITGKRKVEPVGPESFKATSLDNLTQNIGFGRDNIYYDMGLLKGEELDPSSPWRKTSMLDTAVNEAKRFITEEHGGSNPDGTEVVAETPKEKYPSGKLELFRFLLRTKYKDIADMMSGKQWDENSINIISEAVVKHGGTEKELIAKVEALPEYKNAPKTTPMQKAQELYAANILSGIPTHLVNIAGNYINAGIRRPIITLSSIIPDKILNRLEAEKGNDVPRTADWEKFKAEQPLMFLWKLGTSRKNGELSTAANKLEEPALAATTSKFYQQEFGAIPTVKVPKLDLRLRVKIVFDLLDKIDQVFTNTIYDIQKKQALRLAGFKIPEGTDLDNPEVAAEWKRALGIKDYASQKAAKVALNDVFKGEKDNLSKVMGSMIGKIPILKFIIPMFNTSMRVLEAGLDLAVVPPATRLITGNQEVLTAFKLGSEKTPLTHDQVVEEWGKLIAGTALLTIAAGVVGTDDDLVTGEGPDPKTQAGLRKVWLQTHEPYSINIGGRWMPLKVGETITKPIMLMADLRDYQKYRKGTNEDRVVAAKALIHSFSENVTNQSFIAAFRDFLNAASGEEHEVYDVASNTLSAMLPGSSFIRSTADTLNKQIPGVSYPRTTSIYGEELKKTPYKRVVGIYKLPDPISEQLLRLGVGIDSPDKEITIPGQKDKVELTPDEYRLLQTRTGNLTRQYLQKYYEKVEAAPISDEQKAKLYREAISLARKDAKDSIVKQVYQSRSGGSK